MSAKSLVKTLINVSGKTCEMHTVGNEEIGLVRTTMRVGETEDVEDL